MRTWDVMRQDDNGNEFRMAGHDSRISALAQVLAMESGVPHDQLYWVAGPAGPVCRTNRDLYLHVLRLGRDLQAASWSLSAYLRSLWRASLPLRDRSRLEPDQVAALYSAAEAVPPAPYDPAWNTADLSLPGPAPEDHADWERVIFSQLADLEDFAGRPPGPAARFGATAPRPAGAGPRAVPARWLNFDPAGYLECAIAGGLGGWDAADGARVPEPGAPTGSPVRPLTLLSWGDLARLAVCGQQYR
ncbi:hypothetical protein DPM19_32020 [Actinomadura craniellae]|uniref:Uncharacterized protein n=1 Tax=Actinomadura craniellae TaxID=2231787 RepID=A0A365GYX5_9ACTN|nr:hypothetical protein [Actinomadura craniellae]RAY11133.1 hypothetical protein DPM19_32020 [Actinomadura craniellae]